MCQKASPRTYSNHCIRYTNRQQPCVCCLHVPEVQSACRIHYITALCTATTSPSTQAVGYVLSFFVFFYIMWRRPFIEKIYAFVAEGVEMHESDWSKRCRQAIPARYLQQTRPSSLLSSWQRRAHRSSWCRRSPAVSKKISTEITGLLDSVSSFSSKY